ncbi:hypothetical protein BpHYR1_016570, partial [Brachionus plicatilis]
SFPAQIRNDFAAAVSARHVFFSNRVVPHWNELPENAISSMKSAATAPHGQLAVMGSDNLHVRCRSKNYYYYFYYYYYYYYYNKDEEVQ